MTPTEPAEVGAYSRREVDDKTEQALKDAKVYSENAENIKKGIIDVGAVPLRTSQTGARIEWDGVNGLVQYDQQERTTSQIDLDGNARFANAFVTGRVEATEGFFGKNKRVTIGDDGLTIQRPDGAEWMQNGYVHQDFNVSGYDPYATDEIDTPGGRIPAYRIEFDAGRYYAGLTDQIDGTLGFPDVRNPDRGYTLRFQRYAFIHSARYFVMRFQPSNRTDGLDKLRVRLYMGSESVYSRDFSDNEFGSFYSLIVDLGTPTYDRKNIDLYIGFLKQWKKNSIGIAFRFSRIYLTDFL